MDIAQLLQSAIHLNHLSDTAVVDCELLLCYVLDVDRSYLKTWPDRELSSTDSEKFQQLLERRIQGEPVAYLIGTQGFWTLDLNVSPDTLIPRPETELLVEAALEIDLPQQARVLDLGTGTGAIALALASERSQWQISAVDLMPKAVQLAKANCQRHQLDNVDIFQSSWFAEIPAQRFNLIVSNPPYIENEDAHLTQGDVRFEPASALVSGTDGLDDLRLLIAESVDYLAASGWLMVEHGFQQGPAVRELFGLAGFTLVETRQDLNGHERITFGCY
jgi:release factor glutamine methyltransferase|tara:strand:- start:1967 stop:2794 length:828 start_codon:yes stop_codon:yes gene_type:complete